MNFFFALLGQIARISAAMSRFRLNFIPSNWLLVAACLFGAFAGLQKFGFLALPFALILVAVAGAFGFVAAQNHAVFRPRRGGSFPAQSAGHILDLKVSGQWQLGKTRRFFAEIPTNFDLKSDGSRVFVSQIHSTSALFFWQIGKESGEWKISVPPGAKAELEPGALYVCATPRAALRLKWHENGRPKTAILSFGDGPQRAQFLGLWKSVN